MTGDEIAEVLDRLPETMRLQLHVAVLEARLEKAAEELANARHAIRVLEDAHRNPQFDLVADHQ